MQWRLSHWRMVSALYEQTFGCSDRIDLPRLIWSDQSPFRMRKLHIESQFFKYRDQHDVRRWYPAKGREKAQNVKTQELAECKWTLRCVFVSTSTMHKGWPSAAENGQTLNDNNKSAHAEGCHNAETSQLSQSECILFSSRFDYILLSISQLNTAIRKRSVNLQKPKRQANRFNQVQQVSIMLTHSALLNWYC